MAWSPTVVSLIVAHDLRGAIGRNNTLPWHLKADMTLFKENTLNKTVLMGRRTAESIGRALPKRQNLVLTTSGKTPYIGQTAVSTLEEALKATTSSELCIIGGTSVYEAALFADMVDVIKRTYVQATISDADTFLPGFNALHATWSSRGHVLHEKSFPADAENDHPFLYQEISIR